VTKSRCWSSKDLRIEARAACKRWVVVVLGILIVVVLGLAW
jgi:hypothetical protein